MTDHVLCYPSLFLSSRASLGMETYDSNSWALRRPGHSLVFGRMLIKATQLFVGFTIEVIHDEHIWRGKIPFLFSVGAVSRYSGLSHSTNRISIFRELRTIFMSVLRPTCTFAQNEKGQHLQHAHFQSALLDVCELLPASSSAWILSTYMSQLRPEICPPDAVCVHVESNSGRS